MKLLVIKKLIQTIKEQHPNDKVLFSLLMSALSYFSDEFAHDILSKEFGIKESKIIEIDDFKFLQTTYDNQSYVAFRGTLFNRWKNVKKVFNFIPKKNSKGISQHRGFLMAYNKLRNGLSLVNSNESVIFTGHSLGGALALIAAKDYNAHAVTFASPNVFFGKDQLINHVGYKAKNDIVTFIPPKTIFFNWSRAKVEMKIFHKKSWNPFTNHHLASYITTLLDMYNAAHQIKEKETFSNISIKQRTTIRTYREHYTEVIR